MEDHKDIAVAWRFNVIWAEIWVEEGYGGRDYHRVGEQTTKGEGNPI